MLKEFFSSFECVSIKETLNHLNVTIRDLGDFKPMLTKLFEELKTISSRDTYELFIEIDGSSVSISNASSNSYETINNHVKDCYEADSEYEIELKVEKNVVDRTVSVYFIDELSAYIESETPNNIITTLSKMFCEQIFFEVFSTIKPFYSNSIVFYQKDYFPDSFTLPEPEVRVKQIEMFSENCHFTSFDFNFLPSDFSFIKRSDTAHKILKIFDELASVLSVIFISNTSEITCDGKFSYKINGYKMISCNKVDFADISLFGELPHKIYSWAYEGGNKVDKLGLVRNVLSIHLDHKNCISFDNEAWEAIKSNYQVYLKDNLQSYLEVKNKIGEFIIDSTAKTYGIADQLLESLKNNILVILTFLLTVVLVNGLKDNGYKMVFSDGYLAIVIILSLVSIVWLAMTILETNKRFESASSTIKDILKLNYQKVIMESEIEDVVTPVIEKNRVYLQSQLKRYSIWWMVLLGVFVLSFATGNWYFNILEIKDTHTELNKEVKVPVEVDTELDKKAKVPVKLDTELDKEAKVPVSLDAKSKQFNTEDKEVDK